MLSNVLQFLMFASFAAILILVWRVSRWPRWRVHAVIYGWGISALWAVFWSFVLPMWFRGLMDAETLHRTFPEGTHIPFFVFFGWFWPLIVASVANRSWRTGLSKPVDDEAVF